MGKTRGTKDLRLEDKTAIHNLRTYFESEKKKLKTILKTKNIKEKDFPLQFQNVAKRTSVALKISERSVHNVSAEFKSVGSLGKPKKYGRKKLVIDSFTEGVTRRAVVQFYCDKQFPTLQMLHTRLQQDPNYPRMSKSTLRNIVKRQLKFKWVKFQGKPVPLERDDIAAQRFEYLRKIRKYRRDGYKIFYQDESWCNAHQSQARGWHIPEKEVVGMGNRASQLDIWLRGVGHRFTDGLIGGISSKPSGAGKRMIMIDIGSEDGFLSGVGRAFLGKKDSNDYHNEMNTAHFHDWFKSVLEKIPPHSAIVVDRAKYHRSVTPDTRNPTTAWRKADIIAFLKNKNVQVPETFDSFEEMTCPLLRLLAKKNSTANVFEIEKMAEDCGKDVKIIWLPVAHCELNAIELIWSFVKRQVSLKNSTFRIEDVLKLTKDLLASEKVKKLWEKCVNHVKKLEELIMEKESIADEFLEHARTSIIITPEDLNSSDSESSDSDSQSSDSDSEDSDFARTNNDSSSEDSDIPSPDFENILSEDSDIPSPAYENILSEDSE